MHPNNAPKKKHLSWKACGKVTLLQKQKKKAKKQKKQTIGGLKRHPLPIINIRHGSLHHVAKPLLLG